MTTIKVEEGKNIIIDVQRIAELNKLISTIDEIHQTTEKPSSFRKDFYYIEGDNTKISIKNQTDYEAYLRKQQKIKNPTLYYSKG